MSVNKIYKIIWSRTKNCYVVASELAKGQSRNKSVSVVKKSALALGVTLALVGSLGVGVQAATGTNPDTSTATGAGSLALANATANGAGAIALGEGAFTEGEQSIAIGLSSEAHSDGVISIGPDAGNATGGLAKDQAVNSINIGRETTSLAENAVSIGTRASGQAIDAIAIGTDTTTSGKYSVALGGKAVANGGSAVALGQGSFVSAQSAIAIGQHSNATGERSMALGATGATEWDAILEREKNGEIIPAEEKEAARLEWISLKTESSGADSLAMLVGAKATGNNSIAIGANAEAKKEEDVAIGSGAISHGGVAIMGRINPDADKPSESPKEGANEEKTYEVGGSNFAVYGDVKGARSYTIGGMVEGMDSFSVGSNALAQGNYSNAIGFNSAVMGDSSIAIGDYSRTMANNAQALGTYAVSWAEGSLALGANSVVNEGSKNSIAIGPSTSVSGISSIAIGDSTIAAGEESIAIGNKAKTSSGKTIVIGGHAQSDDITTIGENSILSMAIGQAANIGNSAQGSIAIGPEAAIKDGVNYAIAVGNSTVASGQYSIAIGGVAEAQKDFGVALGYMSHADKDAQQIDSMSEIAKGEGVNQVKTTFGNFAGSNYAQGIVSVGVTDEFTRQIINVAPGEVSATSTDAINGSQLFSVAGQVVQNQADIKAVTSTADSTATVVATEGITFAGDVGTPVAKKLGEQIKIYGGKTSETELSEGNIGVVAGADGLEVKLAEKINLGANGQLTIGTTSITPTSITTNEVIIPNGPSIKVGGINAGSQKITNVKDGSERTDAVNYGQLLDAVAKPNISAGNNITIDKPSADNGNTYVINGLNTTVSATNGDKYVKVTPGTAVNGTTDYVVSLTESTQAAIDAVKDKVGKDDVANIAKSSIEVTGKGPNVIVTPTTEPTTGKVTYEVSISNKLDLTKDGSLTIGDTVIDGTQAKVAQTTINDKGVTTNAVTADTVTVGDISITKEGINAGNKQLTNVKSGATGIGADNKLVYDKATNGANIGDVQYIVNNAVSSVASTVNKGMNFKAEGEGEIHRDLGATLEIVGDGNGITTAVKDGKIAISVGDNVMSGQAGQDGKVGATGKDGASVVLNGKDGSIGLTGPAGKDGEPGKTITVKGVQGQPGVDGEDGISRLEVDGREVATLDDGMVYTGDAGDKAAVKLNKNVSIVGGQTDKTKLADAPNIGVVAKQDGENGKLTVQLAKDLTGLNSVTTGNTTINNDGLTVKGKDGKDGTVITNEGITINGKDGLTITGKDGKDGVSITEGGIDMGGNPISNVGDGISPSDVVTKGQFDRGMNKLGNRVNEVGAGAAALAALNPLDFNPDDKWNFAVGYGNYKSSDAFAIGAYYQPNEDTRFSIGSTLGNGDEMINAGVSIRFGQSNGVSTSRVALAKDVESLKRIVQQLVTENEQLRRGGHGATSGYPDISDREFPDVPKNHWAYEYVDTITKKGFTIGYPDGEFKGDRTLTRYEFAAVVYRALKNGAEIDGGMARAIDEFGPELARLEGLDHSRVDRVAGEDNDRYKIERLRVNNKDNEETNDYRDIYGSKIQKEEVAQ